jgi:5-methylcytosine-specific restriction endonuclease McrA
MRNAKEYTCKEKVRIMSSKLRLEGDTYGELTVIRRVYAVKYKSSHWTCKCSCGVEVVIAGAKLRNSHTRSCGHILRGGGVKYEQELSEQSKIAHWSKEVRRRDKHTCQKCGETGTHLHAHHILRRRTHPEKTYDISNGLTLCYRCHAKEHTKEKVNGSFSR